MESKVSYIIVGLFVIILGLVLIAAILWLTVGAQDRAFMPYVVYVRESVAGLSEKSVVRYRGVDVGQVRSIRIDPARPDRVELMLDIEEGTPIREDTIATLVVQGLTGLATIELSGGSPASPPLKPPEGQPFAEIPSSPSLIKRLDAAFTDAMAKLDRISVDMAQLLRPENQRAITEILTNLSEMSALLVARSGSINEILDGLRDVGTLLLNYKDDIGEAVQAAHTTLLNSAKVSAELSQLIEQIGTGASSVQQMADAITKTSTGLDQAILQSRSDIQVIANRTVPELNLLLQELNRLTDSVQRFVEELDRNPQLLLFGKPNSRPGPGERSNR